MKSLMIIADDLPKTQQSNTLFCCRKEVFRCHVFAAKFKDENSMSIITIHIYEEQPFDGLKSKWIIIVIILSSP